MYNFGRSECNRVKEMKISEYRSSIDPDEVSQIELSHLNLL